MTDSEERSRKSGASRGSLLSPEAIGGITGGKGYDFQTRYAACHLPLWLLEGSFHQLFFEGTGDIDIRFTSEGKSSRIHIQVKDHEVAPAEFKSVVEHFQRLDSDFPEVYERFTLASPSLSATLRPIETGLARLRGATPFYDDAPGALASTKQDLDERLRKRSLDDLIDFIHSKVFIDVGHGDLCHDDRAVELFIARLLSHPEYSGKLRSMVQPAFSEIMRAITASKGVVLERAAIEGILRSAVATGLIGKKSITLWVQNWTKESFDPPADYALDWSSHFDRASRRVPSQEVWNAELLSELSSLQKRIVAERKERVIRFRGKCALSTGIAMGAVFPAVGGWVFEIPQPPSKDDWRSDAPATSPYDLRVEVIDGSLGGADLVLGLNIKGDGRGDVMRYVEGTCNRPKIFVFMSPPSQGAQSIGGAGDACAFTRAMRDHLGQILKTHQFLKTRIFFYGPFALAVFLGQQLTSVGEIQLFEYQDPGYIPSCSLRT
ncbi:MAG: dsDNA nuclease domain-containing protein [Acidobacteriia bacterium]|nr:dsDNA nuclease domain-containing protein [Terriglobia bacterium]